MNIRYVEGDATCPQPNTIIIPHVVNDIGAWGAGFVLAVTREWPEVEQAYRQWASLGIHGTIPFSRGQVQFIEAQPAIDSVIQPQPKIIVANMCAQHGVVGPDNPIPLKMNALINCMRKVRVRALEEHAIIHAPMFGAGLAGGNWKDIEQLIEAYWIAAGIPVTVYQWRG